MDEFKIISGLVDIPLDTLHHQYKPKLTPMELYPGLDPMHVFKSHHVGILKLIKKVGLNFKKLKHHPYFQERRHRYNIGMTAWTDGYVMKHLERRWETYRSLKKNGYNKKLAKEKPVIVLKEPIWETRYGWKSGFLHGAEVWDGMGRVSTAILLGWKTIPGYYAEDAMPGTKDVAKFLGKVKKQGLG